MIVKILIGLVVVVGVLVIVILMQPSEYRVARTATIAAPPAAVFPHVNDVRKFNVWNPWSKLDPAAKITFAGPASGPGAVMAWAGDKNVGEGSMSIIESRPNEVVRYRMDFLKPFAGTAAAAFTLKPEGGHTAMTWSMEGRNNFIAKAIHLVMNMDRMIGGQFEKGLANLTTEIKG